MNTELVLGAVTAFWLGILTSISPCPLATNIAAVTFIGREAGKPFRSMLAGILYTLGRALTYAVLGFLLVVGILAVSPVAMFLQTHMNRILGPVLVLAGMILLDLLPVPLPRGGGSAAGRRLAARGLTGAFLLGALFAMAFCPVSAALFFGSLVPIAVRLKSGLLLPSIYGIGTGLPVLAVGVLLALGVKSVGGMFMRVSRAEKWMRVATGVVFVVVGVYFSLVYIFGITI